MSKTINYGIGKEYLRNWGIDEALREIFQNYLDYGDYKIKIHTNNKRGLDDVKVYITNDYKPNNLEFLRIGNSDKGDNINAIGKHGEGLKMAFLIFLRMGLEIKIFTNKYVLYPYFDYDEQIGHTFSICYTEHHIKDKHFTTEFICDRSIITNFMESIISDDEILFKDSYHGNIVNREAGCIFSGRLFVCKLDNLSRAYDLPPSVLSLDRDRCVPKQWDVNYHTSMINQAHGQWSSKDLTYDDTKYISHIPDDKIKDFKSRVIGNEIEFVTKGEDGKYKVVKNDSIKAALKETNYFKKIINKVKVFLAKQLGLYEMLIEFQNKHVHSSEAKADFELILMKVKQ